MEAVPGWRSTLSPAEMILQLQRVGAVICAPGPGLAPTDAKLYAVRDVTATVESIPLIASSIMSKKIAEGTSALVLDVKVGSGAFMKDIGNARQLAEMMVEIGRDHDVRTTAVLTDMNVPLGRAVGNALEVEEAIATLNGHGPADLVDVTLALAREMLELTGLADDRPGNALTSGAAKQVWDAMIRAQGGDPNAPLSKARRHHVIPAASTGYVTRLDALKVGECAWRLGAGRARKEHPVSWIAGVVCHAKPGDRVVEGEPLLELHVDDPAKLPPALEALQGGIEIGREPPAHRPLIIDVIRG
jgi:thymidine phosphorylase